MKRTKYILLTFLVVSVFGCSHFDKLNTNPSRSTDMDPLLLIPTIQMRQSENHQEWHRYLSYPGGFMNQWTGDWACTNYGGRGIKYDNFMEQMWMSYYPFIVRDAVDIVERTRDLPTMVNLHSIARILKVQCFHKITDTYGDVPYFDAGLGYSKDITMPKYDKQQEIYYDLLKELKEASAALDPSGDAITYDFYYNGDIQRWKKYANSLRLRLALRLVKIDPATAKIEAEAAIAAGVFDSNSDICFTQHDNYDFDKDGFGCGNGIAIRMQAPESPTDPRFRITKELVTLLEDGNDPRLLWFCGSYANDPANTDITAVVKAEYGNYKSMSLDAQYYDWNTWEGNKTYEVNGANMTFTNGQWRLKPSKYVTATNSPHIHMSHAEVKLLMAEVAQRGWNAGGKTAQELYSEALEAAIRQWSLFGVTDFNQTAIQSYLDAQLLTSGGELMDINTQLWVLHILDPLETWSNWRRTGMPNLVFKNMEPNANNSNGTFPRRLEYPVEEQLKNKSNYDDAVSRLPGGIDSWNSRVWWDKQ